METTEKIILLLVGKLKLQSQRAILMIITQPTYRRSCPEYLPRIQMYANNSLACKYRKARMIGPKVRFRNWETDPIRGGGR